MKAHKKVLAVDDNADNIAIVRELLQDDYDLRTALTGEEALEIASEFRPDLVLLDIMMPGLDGYEVCRRLRDNPAFSDTTIVMVTAKGALEDKVTGYEAGADDFITKPFTEDNILETVAFFV